MDGWVGNNGAGRQIGRRLGVLALLVVLVLSMALTSSASAAPPEILSSFVSQVGTETAVFKAEINPKGKAVGYRFEYGLSDCSAEPNPCVTEPSLQGTLLTNSTTPEALPPVTLEGLMPGTTYHFRLVVKNSSNETTNGPDRAFKTYLPSPVFSLCPNDAFRLGSLAPPGTPSAQLPDCRTYEQASPTYKQGEDARGTPGSVRAAVEGGGITFNTTNGIPGGEGGQEIPTYLATRSPGNWSTQGLSPLQSAGPTAVVLGWTPDFSNVIEMVRRPEEGNPTALLERSSEGGALSTIVPLTPKLSPAFAGANADGSLVLFESKVALPSVTGAIEGKPNLYLWQRESGEIALAGALNDTQAPAEGALAGAYDWAAGTSPKNLALGGAFSRGYYAQDNHVMSADGSAVYFTAAGTGKLYVRLNPTAPQSATALNGKGEEECTEAGKACTVEVSASQRALPDKAGTRPAAFAAATPDGSIALFVSSEKLTEDANTGPEPPAPTISRAGVGGPPAEASFLGERGAGVAIAGEYLYWADPASGWIGRAKLNGAGAADPVDREFIHIAGRPRWIAAGDEYLYWSEQGEGEEKGEELTDEGSIGRVRLDKSEPPEADIVGGLTDPQGLAVDGEHLYWANHFEIAAEGYIGRASPDGSGANPKWLPLGGEIPQGVAVSAAGVYWSSNAVFNATSGERIIGRANLDGSNIKGVKVSKKLEEGSMRGIALDAGHVYWASSRIGAGDKFEIGRDDLSLSEENLERDFILIEGKPKGVAVDGEHLYWSLNGEPPVNPGNDLYRFEPDKPAGERLTDLSVDSGEENGAEVRGLLGVSNDGARVYFAANGVLTDAPNEAGEAATPGDCRGSIAEESGSCETNVYLSRPDPAHPGALEIVFFARVSGADRNDWRPNSVEAPRTSRVTPNGEALLFASHRSLTSYDSEGTSELYLYREGAGIRCVSCDPSGAPPQGVPDLGGWLNLSFLGPSSPAPLLTRNLSGDGQQVFFETTDALLPGDTNGAGGCPIVGPINGLYPSCLDVYEWEAKGSGSCESETEGGGCLYLLSPAGSKEASFLGDASASGEDVFVFTRSPLVRQDTDQLLDAYDVRTEGGLASQNVVPPPVCEGDACKQGASGPPPFQGPQTPNFQGPGNPKEKGCPKGKRKVTQKGKTRCVAKKKKHQGKSKKKGEQKAKKSGRAGR